MIVYNHRSTIHASEYAQFGTNNLLRGHEIFSVWCIEAPEWAAAWPMHQSSGIARKKKAALKERGQGDTIYFGRADFLKRLERFNK